MKIFRQPLNICVERYQRYRQTKRNFDKWTIFSFCDLSLLDFAFRVGHTTKERCIVTDGLAQAKKPIISLCTSLKTNAALRTKRTLSR